MKNLFIVLYFIYMFITMPLSAAPVLKLQENIDAYTDFHIEYFEDKSDKPLGIDEIQKAKFQTTTNAFTFGYSTNNFWFRIKVVNSLEKTKTIFLELTEILHKNLDLYVISSNNEIEHERNGLSVPVNERNIKVSNPTFFLEFEPGESKVLYIKLTSIFGIFGEFQLKSPQKFLDTMHLKEKIYMFYYGAVITIAFYNLFIFFFLREKIYLYYVSYVAVFIIWSANYRGILLPYTNMEIYDILQVTVPIFFTLLILFTQDILQTKKYFLKFHYLLNTYKIILIVLLLWMLTDMHSGFHFMNIVASPLLPLLLIIAFWALYKGHKIARIYLIALSIYLISMVILSQMALSYIPYDIFISNAPLIGSFFEIILLSLMLAYRINVLRDERISTQEKLLVHKATEGIRLTKMVNEKTEELSKINDQLAIELAEKKKLEKILQRKASTDSLTGVLNRRAFFDTCAKEMNIAKRYNHDLSFIIVDIDYFKDINDTYGHLNGDIVLLDLVKVINNTIRTTDIFGRIGGEEFAVLMPETDIDNAEKLAERIRINISKNESRFEDHAVKVTVSIGLSFMKPEDSIIQHILRRADLALFKAKESGRNQICSFNES